MHFQKLGSQLETLAPQMHLVYCWTSNTLFVCLVWVVHVFLIFFGSLSSVVVLINSIHNNGLEIWRRCTLWNVSVCVIDRKKASHTRINTFLRGNQLNPIEGQLMAFFLVTLVVGVLFFTENIFPSKTIRLFVVWARDPLDYITGSTQKKTANSLLLMDRSSWCCEGSILLALLSGLCQFQRFDHENRKPSHHNSLSPLYSDLPATS